MTAALRALERLAATPPEADLSAWAARIATADGAVALLGTDLRAAPYPGLLWSGERCARAGLGAEVMTTLVGLVVGAEHGRSPADVGRAVRTGLAVAGEVARPGSPASVGVVPAAVCAAVLAGVPDSDLPAVLDLAGSLLAVTPPDGPWAGHSAAAGWLAAHTFTTGLVGMPDGLGHTLDVLDGLR